MLRATWLPVVSLSIVIRLGAQQSPGAPLGRCASIPQDSQRLACYDSLAGRTQRVVPSQPTETGEWVIKDTINPLNDTRRVSLMLSASSGQSRLGRPVVLVLRCQNSKTEAYVAWGSYISDEGGVVISRIGTDQPETGRWHVSGDNTATFYPKDAVQFIQRLMKTGQLVVQTTPYNENPIQAVFDLTGLLTAVQPLRAACGW